MTTESANSNETAVKRVPGRPFLPGQTGNPNGRPRKKLALRDILTGIPIKQKRELVAVAYECALDGDVHWAEWIAKHSGEGLGAGDLTVNIDNRRVVVYHNGERE